MAVHPDGDTSFDLLGDSDLLNILQNGMLDEEPAFSNTAVTATQVLGIETQQLLHARDSVGSTVESKPDAAHSDVPNPPSVACTISADQADSNSGDRKPLCAKQENNQAVHEHSSNERKSARFGEPISETQIRDKNARAVPKKTRTVNNWSVKVWADWARNRNTQPATAHEPGFPLPEDIAEYSDFLLNYWGQRFVYEIKGQDGLEYPPNTLHQLVCGLQRYLKNDCGKEHINFMKEDSAQFRNFRRSIDTIMKELFAAGLGSRKASSDPVTMQDELKLWETGVFSMDTAHGLSNAVFYYNGKLFGFRGFQEHVSCQGSQFEILMDQEHNRRYILFTPGLRKNSQGGLKRRKTVQEPIRHYEQPDRQFNIVELYTRYLSLIPRTGPFYRRPLNGLDENNNIKFSASTISHNCLKSMMKNFFNEAGIDTNSRKITNHSARVTLCTTMYNKDFTDKAVTSRSKHRSNAVHVYQREQFDMMNKISGALEPSLKRPPIEPSATVTSPPSHNIQQNVTGEDLELVPQPKVKIEHLESERGACGDTSNDLMINVPQCVQRVVIVKTDGKKIIIDT